jgi:hypothetical protein
MDTRNGTSAVARGRIPLPVKIAYSAFMAVLVPAYLAWWGPTNFAYFCDQALLITLVGIWLESPLLISLCAVGLLGPQALWVADFASTALGFPITGMTNYMFDARNPLATRGLSLFHGWLPFLLGYLVWRLGYDRRALAGWTAMAAVTLVCCWLFLPGPNPDAGSTPVNVNYVWGLSDAAPQTWMPPLAWLALMVAGLPLVFFLPTHLLLRRFAPAPAAPGA